MAWQLIYTSAPRSLEAGRSGFGTVARHRAINPLLASAVERISQFSRQPGFDTGRVIYSYRSLPIAGATYHILTSVRDAGADYTGRTNHIAHHLVAEAREVAHLGASGPSPADILLGMTWATAWTELPRYLEADEEIPLAGFHPLVHGSEWKHVTGRATQAWLLAMPEAIRGAYVISSPVMDLRQIFGESLRLVPDRLWKIPFTTSFQPSDEPADLRWIGVESTSPMRAQTEAPGRPVFDLSVPESLQLVEVEEPEPAPAPPVGVPAGATYPAIAGLPVPSAFANPGAPAPAPTPRVAAPEFTTRPARVRPAPGNSGSSYVPPRSGSHNRWILVGAGIVLAVLAIVAVVFIKPMIERKQAIEAVAARFGQADPQYGGGVDAIPVATTLVDRFEKPTRDPLIDAAVRLNQTLKAGRLTELNSKQTTDDLAEITGNDTGQLPPELHRLRTDVQAIRGLLESPAGFQSEMDADRLKKLADEQAEQFRKLFPASSSIGWQGSLLEEFQRTVDRRLAQSLLRLVTETSGLPYEGGGFQTKIDNIENGMHDSEALATMAQVKDTVKKLLRERQARLQKAQTATPPVGANNLPNGIPGVGDPAAQKPATPATSAPTPNGLPGEGVTNVPNVSLLFISSNKRLPLDLPDGGTGLSYSISVGGKPEENLKPYLGGGLGPYGESFTIQGGKLVAGKNPPQPPYTLTAKRGNTEVIRFYVGADPHGGAIFGTADGGISRKADSLIVDLAKLPGGTAQSLFLRLPPGFSPLPPSSPSPPDEVRAGVCDIARYVRDLNQAIARGSANSDLSDGAIKAENQSIRAEVRRLAAEAKPEKKGKGKKDGADPQIDEGIDRPAEMLAMLFQKCWERTEMSPNPVAKVRAELAKKPEDANWDDLMSKLRGDFNGAHGQMDTAERYKQILIWVDAISALSERICKIEKERQIRSAHASEFRAQAAKNAEVAKNLSVHPLANGQVPPGTYTLLVDDGENKLPIIDFQVH